MNITVTGGAGFIGANLCAQLSAIQDIDSITVIDDLSTGRPEHLDGLDVRLLEGSVLDPGLLDEGFENADAIVHLGALGSVPRSVANPVASHHANATGTIEVLEAARRHGNLHTVVASSSSVYGDSDTLPKSEDLPTRPMSPYAASKLATEWYSLAYQHSYGLPVLAFRFFNVYGPLQRSDHAYAPVIPAFISAALADQPLRVHGDGRQSRDFTFVDTVCETMGRAVLERVTSPVPVNLAFGSSISLLEIIEHLERLLGRDLPVEHTDHRAGDMRHTQADPSRLRALFPSVGPIPFEDGLRATLAWHLGASVGRRGRDEARVA